MRYTLADPSTALQGGEFGLESGFQVFITKAPIAQQSAVMASLTIAISSTITASNNFDDILALARPFNESNPRKTIP